MRTKLMLFMLAAITLTACSSDDSVEDNKTVNPKLTYRLEVQAENGAKTRALSLDPTGKILTASWNEGEKVGVHTVAIIDEEDNIGPIYIGYISAQEEGNPTTFTGDVQELDEWHYQNAAGTNLCFTYPNPEQAGGAGGAGGVFQYYDGQDGTIETIASKFDYASATAKVERVTENNGKLYIMLAGGNKITFQNHTAITAFTIVDENDVPVRPASFKVNGKGLVKEYNRVLDIEDYDPYTCFHDSDTPPTWEEEGLTISAPPHPEQPLFVAMSNKYDEVIEYSFWVSSRKASGSQVDSYYECKMKANLKPGTFYATKLKMKEVDQWGNQ